MQWFYLLMDMNGKGGWSERGSIRGEGLKMVSGMYSCNDKAMVSEI